MCIAECVDFARSRVILLPGTFVAGDVRVAGGKAYRNVKLVHVGYAEAQPAVYFTNGDLVRQVRRCIPLLNGGPHGPGVGVAERLWVAHGRLFATISVPASSVQLLGNRNVGCVFADDAAGWRLRAIYLAPHGHLDAEGTNGQDDVVNFVKDEPEPEEEMNMVTRRAPRPPGYRPDAAFVSDDALAAGSAIMPSSPGSNGQALQGADLWTFLARTVQASLTAANEQGDVYDSDYVQLLSDALSTFKANGADLGSPAGGEPGFALTAADMQDALRRAERAGMLDGPAPQPYPRSVGHATGFAASRPTPGERPPSPERLRHLLSQTALGQQVLAERDKR
jgi:hypothetical protein